MILFQVNRFLSLDKLYLALFNNMWRKIIFLCVLCFNNTHSNAQLCNGSLGDPLVNITFGHGSNPGASLTSVSTNYIYTSSSCPIDGYYTVVNSMTDCFGGSWHILLHDHTGDSSGYMMLINAAPTPGIFYLDKVSNLCANTTYEFSAWIISVEKLSSCGGNANKPNITFSIETTGGTVLKTYNTGDIPNLSFPLWVQYGFYFSLPSGVSDLVLRMTNNAPGNCGNDLAIDDITFRPCGPLITADFSNVAGQNGNVNLCLPISNSVTVAGNVASFSNPAYQWQQSLDSGVTWSDVQGATNIQFSTVFTKKGFYKFRLSVADAFNIGSIKCRVFSNPLSVNVDDLPATAAQNSSPACVGDNITLTAKDGDQYLWSGPNGFVSTNGSLVMKNVGLQSSGKYYLRATKQNGCSTLDSTIVTINSVPTANAGADQIICENNNVLLHASGGIRYLWSPSADFADATLADQSIQPANTTVYSLTAFNQYNCFSNDSVKITVLKNIKMDAGSDMHIMQGESVQLHATVSGDVDKISWSPLYNISNAASLNPVVSPDNDFIYTITATSPNNVCSNVSDEVFIKVFKNLNIPNVFSPNGDGINDTWVIDKIEDYPQVSVKVFNRYGQIVFLSTGNYHSWDGTYNGAALPVGTYFYLIDRGNGLPLKSGSVSIIR